MKSYVIEDWLLEADMPFVGSPGDAPAGGPPTNDPYSSQLAQNQSADMTQQNQGDPNVGNMPNGQPEEPEDINDDPQTPDMPQEMPKHEDFEVWRNKYLKESIKGDTNQLVDLLSAVRGKSGLSKYQKKFIDDNWNIQLIRQNANIERASKDIRKNIKDQLDRNNPATTVVNHLVSVLETDPTLNNIFIKLANYGNLKGDLHRKFIAGLIGGVQVGSGANTEDVIYNENEYSILMSTRFNSEWGEIMIGNWCLRENDAERYLSSPEQKRLEDGSPAEKDVIRKRIILESIAKQFETRAFYINVVNEEGTIFTIGWDIAGSLRAAYTEGKIIVKMKVSDGSEAMITEEGRIVGFMDVDIHFAKETGEQKEDGSPEVQELPFLERRNGTLFLTADMNTIKEASSSMQGIVFKETPYRGNPSDLDVLSKCIYTSADLLMRTCQ